MEQPADHNHGTSRQCTEEWFPLADCELFYRHWPAQSDSDQVLFIFHRGHEHSGRLQAVVDGLNLPAAHIIAWDARGHGRSPGKRGFAPDGFATLVQDMDDFVRGVCGRLALPLERAVILAHSVASVVASTWVHDHAPAIAGLVLVTPAFRVRLYVPLALPALTLANRLLPDLTISSYVKGRLLSHDPEAAASYDHDELVSKAISNRILVEMAAAAKRVVADAHTLRVPLLMLQAGSDWVVSNAMQDQFFRRCGSLIKQRVDLPGFYHAALHEQDAWRALQPIRRFIADRWRCEPPTDPDLLAHGDPVNALRFRALSRRPSLLSVRGMIAQINRMALRWPGGMSKGIAIGWRSGFDSGQSLDHVYRNHAEGTTSLGRLIDRVYLDAIGWQGIRLRKDHISTALSGLLEDLRSAGRDLHLLDIASGPGRYLIDFLRVQGAGCEAVLRDRDLGGLEEGRALAAAAGLKQVRYEQGDAFDPESLSDLRGWPSIGIVSGLYELFSDNQAVLRSLGGLHAAMQPSGYLVYTNQPWHPQLRFIADVLPNRDGEPWVMRCRPQAEMDALVATAGFRKLRTWADPWGIFTVSVARKAEG
jgi:alpha-beta hydrolase superfamily lysophospholipase/SAM-dependent methyltransferase